VPIESVTCPGNADFKAGSTFECEAKAQGVNFGIQVKMENDQGKFNTNIKGLLLNLSKIEDKLQATLKEKAGTDVTADCGGKLRAAKTGDTFTCQLKNKEGQTRNVQITVKNEKGELDVKLGNGAQSSPSP
jgi:C-terminal processing protease CtpA/Prc